LTPLSFKAINSNNNLEEGIDYGETFAPVARLDVVWLLLAFACLSGFKLFQMDDKSAFLNGIINEDYNCLFSFITYYESNMHPLCL